MGSRARILRITLTLTVVLSQGTLVSSGQTFEPNYSQNGYSLCPDPSHNYCPGKTLRDRDPSADANAGSCYYQVYYWDDDPNDPTGAKRCMSTTWPRPCPRGSQLGAVHLNERAYECDAIFPPPQNPTPSPTPGPSGGGGTPAPPPVAQPLVLIGGTGLLDCPTNASDCRPCPSGSGSSDSASCGPSGFSNAMVESLSRQAAKSTLTDQNLKAADELKGAREGID